MSTLIAVKPPQHRFLVFTSAGDCAQVGQWCRGRLNFDLWITYYGDTEGKFQEYATYWNARKGTKFPNFLYIHQHHQDLLDRYEAIWVVDDDVVITGSQISRLFEFREQYDLWILQPAFDPKGKISFDVTCVQPLNLLRYTNFVEVTCPLFRKDKLDQFMAVYDPNLVGYGVEAWFLNVLHHGEPDVIAIIDSIPCINPYDMAKGGIRAIDQVQSLERRIAVFKEMRQKYNISWNFTLIKAFGSVPKKWTLKDLIYSLQVWCLHNAKRFLRIVLHGLKALRKRG